MKKYEITSDDRRIRLKGQLQQKIKTLTRRLRRYQEIKRKQSHNKIFNKNEKIFHRSLGYLDNKG